MQQRIKFTDLTGDGAPLEISFTINQLHTIEVTDATTVILYFNIPYPDRAGYADKITLTTTSGKSDEVHDALLSILTTGSSSATSSPTTGSSVFVAMSALISYNTSTTDVTALVYTPGA